MCYTVICAVLLLISNLESAKFIIRTDRDTLKWISDLADVTGVLVIWRPRLSEIDFDIVHQAGTKNQAADALSQLSTKGLVDTTIDDALSGAFIDPKGE